VVDGDHGSEDRSQGRRDEMPSSVISQTAPRLISRVTTMT
jgi:hypothetical protein